MMWWGVDGSGAVGWSWLGVVMVVLCVMMMARMMRGGMHGKHHSHRGNRPGDRPERILAERLVGEIDTDEYTRLLGALQRPVSRTGP